MSKQLFVWFYVGLTIGVAWYPKHKELILSLPFVTIQYKWGTEVLDGSPEKRQFAGESYGATHG